MNFLCTGYDRRRAPSFKLIAPKSVNRIEKKRIDVYKRQFLDVEKAFDSVWHDGLLFKLREVQLPDCFLHLVASFLTERTFCVRVGDSVSSERRITAGVPQGSVLGPLLFSIYVNDVPRQPGVQMALFADDTAVFLSLIHI